jgi:hypothetical protein
LADFFIGNDKRLSAFQNIADVCKKIISEQIIPKVNKIRFICQKYADDSVNLGKMVSPSDFGFHNALLNSGNRIFFHDFEYAGRDSAVKMLLDFWAQPRVPVDIVHFRLLRGRTFFDGISLPVDAWVALYELTLIKWVLIKLNVFIAGRGKLKAQVMGSSLDRLRENRVIEVRGDLHSLPLKAKSFKNILEEMMGN